MFFLHLYNVKNEKSAQLGNSTVFLSQLEGTRGHPAQTLCLVKRSNSVFQFCIAGKQWCFLIVSLSYLGLQLRERGLSDFSHHGLPFPNGCGSVGVWTHNLLLKGQHLDGSPNILKANQAYFEENNITVNISDRATLGIIPNPTHFMMSELISTQTFQMLKLPFNNSLEKKTW